MRRTSSGGSRTKSVAKRTFPACTQQGVCAREARIATARLGHPNSCRRQSTAHPKRQLSGRRVIRRLLSQEFPMNRNVAVATNGGKSWNNIRNSTVESRLRPPGIASLRLELCRRRNHPKMSLATRVRSTCPWMARCNSPAFRTLAGNPVLCARASTRKPKTCGSAARAASAPRGSSRTPHLSEALNVVTSTRVPQGASKCSCEVVAENPQMWHEPGAHSMHRGRHADNHF